MIYKTEFQQNGLRIAVEVEIDHDVNEFIVDSDFSLSDAVTAATRELHNEVAHVLRGEW